MGRKQNAGLAILDHLADRRPVWCNCRHCGGCVFGQFHRVSIVQRVRQNPDIKAELITSTESAVEQGAFGAPTMYMDGDMYFGQDRLDFIEEALRR